MPRFVLALDQGTTSSRAIVFNHSGEIVSVAQREFEQILPKPGWVEHDPEAIWQSQVDVARQAVVNAGCDETDLAAIGITNQRETTILWHAASGRPVANAIVWQSRASAEICRELREAGHEPLFRRKTGLLLDPYFSGTKVKLLLDSHDGLRRRAERGEILFGTVDSYLIWRLTEGRTHVTDVSNASRTLLMDLTTLQWDDELLKVLGIPRAMLPEIRGNSEFLGETTLLGKPLPITGCAGDQQAATFGQACFEPGSAKNTYGTGCFMLLNTGEAPVASQNNLLTTVGWTLNGQTTYCLEGSVFICGAVVQWLRDGLKVIQESVDVERLASEVEHSDGVYLVPAFVGMGAPYWDPYARGTIQGITRGTTSAHLALAAIESMAYQSRDVLEAMQKDAQIELEVLKVDGGATINDRLLQFQADILDVPVKRPKVAETTALGAAYLAGLAVGFWESTGDIQRNWQLDRQFDPAMDADERRQRCAQWDEAVRRSLQWESS